MSGSGPWSWLIRSATTAGLVVDAGIHFDLAHTQPPAMSGHLSQASLFYAEGVLSVLVAMVVFATGARLAFVLALLVAASALAAVVLYRYIDVGAIGPLPDMYEPFWYPSKLSTTVAEAIAILTAAVGILTAHRRRIVH